VVANNPFGMAIGAEREVPSNHTPERFKILTIKQSAIQKELEINN
jgi:hypothetical protein